MDLKKIFEASKIPALAWIVLIALGYFLLAPKTGDIGANVSLIAGAVLIGFLVAFYAGYSRTKNLKFSFPEAAANGCLIGISAPILVALILGIISIITIEQSDSSFWSTYHADKLQFIFSGLFMIFSIAAAVSIVTAIGGGIAAVLGSFAAKGFKWGRQIDFKRIFSASKVPIAIVLGITLLFNIISFASALNALRVTTDVSNAKLFISFFLSIIATFWIGYNGAKRHNFSHQDALAGGIMAAVANGILSTILFVILGTGIFGASHPYTQGRGAYPVSAIWLLTEGAVFSIGGTILAIIISSLGWLAGITSKPDGKKSKGKAAAGQSVWKRIFEVSKWPVLLACAATVAFLMFSYNSRNPGHAFDPAAFFVWAALMVATGAYIGYKGVKKFDLGYSNFLPAALCLGALISILYIGYALETSAISQFWVVIPFIGLIYLIMAAVPVFAFSLIGAFIAKKLK